MSRQQALCSESPLDQGIHLEMSLVKSEHQLTVPSVDAKHDVTESLHEGGQGHELGGHLLGPLVHDRLLLIRERLHTQP